MDTSIPVGLIGLGRHGNRYLQHLSQKETGGDLIAISRKQWDKGRKQAKEHRLRFFPDYRDLVADPAIQAVLVVTPPAMNAPIALEAIKYKKAVLIEKPLTLNSIEGKHLVETAKQADSPLMTGHTLRYDPVIQKLQEIGSTIGPWQSFNGTMHLETRPEVAQGQGTGIGVLLEIGIHLLDWVRVQLHNERLTVSAKMARPSQNAPEEQSEITLSTPSGISGHLDIARTIQKRETHIEIKGTTGRIYADWTNGVVQIFKQEILQEQYEIPTTPTIIPMLQDFFQALRKGSKMPIPGEDGLRAVELADACYQSEKSGQPVSVG